MGRGGMDRSGYRGSKSFDGRGARGSYDDRYDPKNGYQNPDRDLRDLYDELQDPASEDYLWPEYDTEDED
ncbi:MAG: hypothetical protein NTZ39_09325 [Methanoregula sp.]|nr:hypothetical protein [Methanoregula sp.]